MGEQHGAKAAPAYRLRAYARFFATPRSIKQAAPVLLSLGELTDEEHEVYTALEKELLGLRTSAEARPPRKK